MGFIAFTAQAFSQDYPDYQSVFVNDYANILDQETKNRIQGSLQKAKQNQDQEITLLTINSRRDYGEHASIESFATGLFNSWGIGNPQRNDGILILVSVKDREMRIELGSGFPEYFDTTAKAIIDESMIPHFRQDNYSRGIEQGVDAVIQRINLGNPEEILAAEALSKQRSPLFKHPIFLWIGGFIATVAGLIGGRKAMQFIPKKCPHCQQRMVLLGEQEDDTHLNSGQVLEENLNSKNYDVWHCQIDNNFTIIGRNKWFSSYSNCKECGFRTVHSIRTVLERATTQHSGRARNDFSCKKCSAHWSKIVTLPRITKSSSSSSSSFSGGSSSGGGASGSW